VRRHWREPGFWRWWWNQRVATELKVGLGVGVALVMAVTGYVVASGLVSEAEASGTEVIRTTVDTVVTVKRNGRLVRITTSEVRTGPGRVLTHTVTTPGGVRIVESTVERLVRGAGAGGRTVVDRSTVTNRRTVVDERTVTDQRTVTSERVTTQERVRTETLTEPPVTQVVTQTVTRTVPVTVTQTVSTTVTVGLPPIITVTITVPGG
jgi:hypothetical protein